MLINKDQVAIRVYDDEAGWPSCVLVRLLHQLHTLCFQLALQLVHISDQHVR